MAAALATIQSTAKTNSAVSYSKIGDPQHLSELGFRLSIIAGRPAIREKKSDAEPKAPPSLRTKQRWAKAHREGGPMAAAPKWANSGNRKPRIEHWHRKFLHRQIKDARRSAGATSRSKAHVSYSKALEALSAKRKSLEKPVSYGYFCRLWCRRNHDVGDAYERGGRRLANAVAPHGDVDKQVPLATGPFQVAHIDHCLAPSHSASTTEGEEKAGQPWLTLLVDDWESEPLAMVITFNRPSAATDLELIRDCVRRHGRLPHTIFSDHGSDFKGNVFIGALAVLGLDGLLRPEANPRAGQPVERTFSTFAETVCRGYEGFALNIPNARAISADKHPSKGKKRSFEDLSDHCEHLLFKVIPNLKSIEGGDTRLQKRLTFESVYGRQGKSKSLNLEFLIATAPPLKDAGCFEPSGAIRIGEKRFYSEELIGQDFGRRRPPLRHEPEDKSVIYFALRGKWRVAKARDALQNHGRSNEVIAREAHARTRPTAQERDQRRRALHSKPPARTPSAISSAADKARSPKPQTPGQERISLADVNHAPTLPPAFSTCVGGAQ